MNNELENTGREVVGPIIVLFWNFLGETEGNLKMSIRTGDFMLGFEPGSPPSPRITTTAVKYRQLFTSAIIGHMDQTLDLRIPKSM